MNKTSLQNNNTQYSAIIFINLIFATHDNSHYHKLSANNKYNNPY